MIEMRWKSDSSGHEASIHIGGYPECPFYYVLQYRDVVERDEDGEVIIATEWVDVPLDKS